MLLLSKFVNIMKIYIIAVYIISIVIRGSRTNELGWNTIYQMQRWALASPLASLRPFCVQLSHGIDYRKLEIMCYAL